MAVPARHESDDSSVEEEEEGSMDEMEGVEVEEIEEAEDSDDDLQADSGLGAVSSPSRPTQESANLLQCFWGLASVDETERAASAANLLALLRAAQDNHKVCVVGCWVVGGSLERPALFAHGHAHLAVLRACI